MTTNELLASALLSEATYADLAGKTAPKDLEGALIAGGFSKSQAAKFVTQWRVVDHQPNTSTGLSATLFERLDSSRNGTGEFTLAVRGTEPSITDPRDLIVDLLLATDRLSPQSLELNNYYNRLVSEGKLAPTQQLTVAGHSLGGFLAQIFANQHPSVTKHAYTYDAPGIGGVVAEVLETFGLTAAQLNNALIDNLYAAPGSEVTSNLGTMLGLITPLFIEQSKNALDNHDIKRLTDTLAVSTLFNQVDASVGTEDLGFILNAGSSNISARLETAIAALGDLFGKNYPAQPYGRDDFYANYYELQATMTAANKTNLSLKPLTNQSAAEMASAAQTDIAYRYALVQGNTFAITGDESLYTPQNTGGQLDIHDARTGKGQLTPAYLDDRAAFLAGLIKRQTTDTTPRADELAEYHDLASGQLLFVDAASHASPAKQFVFGSERGEALAGLGGDDHLYGGAGNIVINGLACASSNYGYAERMAALNPNKPSFRML
ncbi:MAG: alpha/beta hydrolase family protein [Halothiobacillus sp.]